MRKVVILLVAVALATAGIYYYKRGSAAASAAPAGGPGAGRGGGRAPMSVDVAPVSRARLTEDIQLVGNLVGSATVQVVPKVGGRLASVRVRIGDTVSEGQVIATIEDQEIRQQVRQAEAAYEVAQATIRQRQADLKFAQTSLDRSRSLFERQLLPKQTLDDADARYQAASAQLDLARAQNSQSGARLQELRLTLGNTVVRSPVTGFVGQRFLDVGGFASTNQPVFSVVDIRLVRLVANLVERDVKRVQAGTPAAVEVDAFPGETFTGRVGRIAPVFDPQTRTAQMEIEVPNPTGRLKPGMYARVSLRVGDKPDALTVPRNAIVERPGARGVFVVDGQTARFRTVETGIENPERVEVVAGVREGERVVTTGAGALQDGDRLVLPGAGPQGAPAAPAGRGQ
ncbi:MAG TPA: efflux RND transporter periplasmic adaptor subunit [Vicinamibacterales bacterium]|nr:efflux RND transporter periplasmic adaptor subunit [Vicinamibacterales bacterium]